MESVNIFWFRRDLRLKDNVGLEKALYSGLKVIPVFIFDDNIIDDLDKNDPRINFIFKQLKNINAELNKYSSSIYVIKAKPVEAFKRITKEFKIKQVFANKDYETYSVKRDKQINDFLSKNNIELKLFKDTVIFEENEILKSDGKPYTVFTPYKNKWHKQFDINNCKIVNSLKLANNFAAYKSDFQNIKLEQFGFQKSKIIVKPYSLNSIKDYHKHRDFPGVDKGTYLGPHLRFGTIGIREIISKFYNVNETFINELIWREFFMQILFNFPDVENNAFRKKYENLKWDNNEKMFEKWKNGKTGYPIVDAGIRELNTTGYMHNRVRMIVASFLVKHLLIDWKWGEAYFAEKLLDFELSSNNGNWQWVAGTGCDAAPYFRVFNPTTQQQKFDEKFIYIKKYLPYFNTNEYFEPIIEHKYARERAINTYSNTDLH